MSPMPPKEMSKVDQTLLREWAQEHGKAVRQRTERQYTTKHNAGTLPLIVYEKELPFGRETPVKTRNMTLVLTRKKENEQKTKDKIPLTSMRSTFYQDQFVLALVELFLCHIIVNRGVPSINYGHIEVRLRSNRQIVF